SASFWRPEQAAKRFPWLANVTLYGCLFAGGDLVHQLIAQKERIDWKHTRNVAIVAISFHGNFNYFWLRALERRFPGKSAGMVFRKLLLDQSFASPLATSVFYTGRREMRLLYGDIKALDDEVRFPDKTGLMYWPFMQFLNFVLMPLYMRTAFMGCCAFLWATFLCFSRQNGDDNIWFQISTLSPKKSAYVSLICE
uniref:MPV17 mitochondrial membrane protein like n=1 Tax=Lates calcarifer TaxID=8187 RepID=A0A4W6DUA3_LATCA